MVHLDSDKQFALGYNRGGECFVAYALEKNYHLVAFVAQDKAIAPRRMAHFGVNGKWHVLCIFGRRNARIAGITKATRVVNLFPKVVQQVFAPTVAYLRLTNHHLDT